MLPQCDTAINRDAKKKACLFVVFLSLPFKTCPLRLPFEGRGGEGGTDRNMS